MKYPCPRCGFKNEVGSKYCSGCAAPVPPQKEQVPSDAKTEHRDIAHPITQEFREYLQKKILNAYQQEVRQGSSSGYNTGRPSTRESSS
jgi:hypothetical protein